MASIFDEYTIAISITQKQSSVHASLKKTIGTSSYGFRQTTSTSLYNKTTTTVTKKKVTENIVKDYTTTYNFPNLTRSLYRWTQKEYSISKSVNYTSAVSISSYSYLKNDTQTYHPVHYTYDTKSITTSISSFRIDPVLNPTGELQTYSILNALTKMSQSHRSQVTITTDDCRVTYNFTSSAPILSIVIPGDDSSMEGTIYGNHRNLYLTTFTGNTTRLYTELTSPKFSGSVDIDLRIISYSTSTIKDLAKETNTTLTTTNYKAYGPNAITTFSIPQCTSSFDFYRYYTYNVEKKFVASQASKKITLTDQALTTTHVLIWDDSQGGYAPFNTFPKSSSIVFYTIVSDRPVPVITDKYSISSSIIQEDEEWASPSFIGSATTQMINTSQSYNTVSHNTSRGIAISTNTAMTQSFYGVRDESHPITSTSTTGYYQPIQSNTKFNSTTYNTTYQSFTISTSTDIVTSYLITE